MSASTGSGLVLLEIESAVATITLNRPERHNSLVPELLQDLLATLASIAARHDIGAVVLQANGRSFSTGGDVQGFYAHRENIDHYADLLVGLLNDTLIAMMTLSVPVVTAVHGLVSGGSLGLLLASDIVLISPQASITPYYSVVGFSPDGGWTAILPQIIGRQRASWILMTNATIDPQSAISWGIASRLVAAESLRAAAQETAHEITRYKPESIRRSRYLLRQHIDDLIRGLEAEKQQFLQQVKTDEARTGILSYLGIDTE